MCVVYLHTYTQLVICANIKLSLTYLTLIVLLSPKTGFGNVPTIVIVRIELSLIYLTFLVLLRPQTGFGNVPTIVIVIEIFQILE